MRRREQPQSVWTQIQGQHDKLLNHCFSPTVVANPKSKGIDIIPVFYRTNYYTLKLLEISVVVYDQSSSIGLPSVEESLRSSLKMKRLKYN